MKKTIILYRGIYVRVERNLPVLTICLFLIGIWLGTVSEIVATSVGNAINGFVDGYGLVAPVVIYMILTPALIRVFSATGTGNKTFVARMIVWFAGTRLAALLWAVIFTTMVFDLPLISEDISSFPAAVSEAMNQLGWMLTHSVYFYAIYASLFSVFVALRLKKLANVFHAGATMIERLGEHLVLVVPLFMLGIGAYVAGLPTTIGEQIGSAYAEQVGEAAAGGGISATGIQLFDIEILGMTIDPTTTSGMVIAYITGALLTGIACMIWHGALLAVAKQRVAQFSIRDYFTNYWVKVYPLLWSTSSEALATPLNLYLVERYYPQINSGIRGFTVGGGSFLGINGTVICVYILGGLVTSILGIEVSFLQLLMTIPLVFLLGYGVPGIPGELVIFAGPLSIILGLPEEIIAVFLALYIGFQIGLPDSFRTGANSTDNCVNALILQDVYEREYLARERKEAAVGWTGHEVGLGLFTKHADSRDAEQPGRVCHITSSQFAADDGSHLSDLSLCPPNDPRNLER